MRHGDDSSFFFRSSSPERRKEALKKSLRVIQGGKQPEPSLWDAETLRDDQFLRLHFLERSPSDHELPLK